MRIGILGHYGNQNLGDEAIIEAAIDSVRRYFPGAEINCFSINPEDTQARHGVPSYPIRYRATTNHNSPDLNKFDSPGSNSIKPVLTGRAKAGRIKEILKSNRLVRPVYMMFRSAAHGVMKLRTELPFLVSNYGLMKNYDLLLITGSNQFLDNFGGVWGFPYTVLKWVVISKLSGTHVALLSLGAGPLQSPVSKLFARSSAILADYVSYRDSASRELVEGKKQTYKSFVFPDMASNLTINDQAPAVSNSNLTTIAINPMPVYDDRYWCDPDKKKYENYVGKLVSTIERLVSSDYDVFLFNTQRQDNNVIEDVLAKLPNPTLNRVSRKVAETTQELLNIIRSADICVATRFHGTVLSLLCGVPVVGICYHRKIGDLLSTMGQGDYQVDLDEFSCEELYTIVLKLGEKLDEERDAIRKASERQFELTESQYARLANQFT